MATAGWRRATFVAVFLSCWKGFSDAQIVDTFSSCENLLPIESFRETDFPDVTTTVRAGEPVNNGQPFFEITTTVGALLSSFSYQVFGVIDGQILPVGVIARPSSDFPCGQASVVGVPQPETDAGISEYIIFWVPLQVDLSTISALLLRCVAVRGNQYEVFEQLLINVLDANVCSPNPCQNGGQCTANVQLQTANCNCIQGFQGLICDRVSENNAPSYPVCPLLSRVTSLAENIGNFVTWMIEDCADTEDGSITPVCNPLSGSLFDLGVSGVTCTCTDSADVSTHCVFLVIVLPVNNAPSTPVCPPVAPRPTIPGNIGNLLSWVIEDCSDVEDTSISPVCDPPSGSFFTVGSRLVTCSCTDSGGLSSQCTFTATVLSEDFSCYVCRGEDQCSRSIQQLQTVSCGPGSICAFVNVTFVLGSGGAPISQLFRDCVEDRTQTAGCVTASSYLNDYIAADFPSIDIISEFGTACFCDVDLCEPEFAVVCSPNPCQNGGTCIPQGPSTFICDCPPGFSRPVCGAPPSRPNCPTDPINERVPLGTSSLALFFGPVTCTTAQLQTITATCTPASGSNFNVGVTNVTCVCTNVVNDVPLRSSCNFQVNVTQVCPVPNPCQNGGTCVPGGLSSFICNCPPGFSRPFCATRPSPPDCPSAPITVQAAPGSQVTVAVFGPFFCDIAPPQQIGILLATCTPSSGSLFGLGLTTVVCVCSDAGATSACEFDVNVLEAPGPCNPNPCRNNGTCVVTGTFETNICLCPPRIFGDMCQFPMVDTNPPLIVGCPDDITIDVDLSSGGTEVSFTEPTAIDDSGVDILSRSHAPGDFFTVGETTVVYIFEDFSGNNATCEFRVVVNPVDTNPPVIDCPTSISVSTDQIPGGNVVTFTQPTATDDSGIARLIFKSHDPGSSFAIGETTVIYIFEDPIGNTATCEFCVNVTEGLIIGTCPPPVTINSGDILSYNRPFCTNIQGGFVSFSTCNPPSGTTLTTSTSVTCTCDNLGRGVCSFQATVVALPIASVCSNGLPTPQFSTPCLCNPGFGGVNCASVSSTSGPISCPSDGTATTGTVLTYPNPQRPAGYNIILNTLPSGSTLVQSGGQRVLLILGGAGLTNYVCVFTITGIP